MFMNTFNSIHKHTHIHLSIPSKRKLFILFNIYVFFISFHPTISATFPLTFAYISDCVEDKKKRAPAFGLALATFGLSFCLGPVSGSYLAKQFGDKSVFLTSFVLVLVNISYIVFFLPETVKVQVPADVSTYV
jgi:MFS family permease